MENQFETKFEMDVRGPPSQAPPFKGGPFKTILLHKPFQAMAKSEMVYFLELVSLNPPLGIVCGSFEHKNTPPPFLVLGLLYDPGVCVSGGFVFEIPRYSHDLIHFHGTRLSGLVVPGTVV